MHFINGPDIWPLNNSILPQLPGRPDTGYLTGLKKAVKLALLPSWFKPSYNWLAQIVYNCLQLALKRNNKRL